MIFFFYLSWLVEWSSIYFKLIYKQRHNHLQANKKSKAVKCDQGENVALKSTAYWLNISIGNSKMVSTRFLNRSHRCISTTLGKSMLR